MDPDEIIVLIGSLAVSCVAGFKWYDRLTSAAPPYCAATPGVRWTLALLPLVLLLALGYCAGTEQPSRLQSRGVLRVLLVIDAANMLSSAGQPEADLAHTLLRWQEAGIHIESCGVDDTLELRSSPDRITVERPRWFRALWHNALSVFGLTKTPPWRLRRRAADTVGLVRGRGAGSRGLNGPERSKRAPCASSRHEVRERTNATVAGRCPPKSGTICRIYALSQRGTVHG